jgi:methyl-accepting chemotaxis protein
LTRKDREIDELVENQSKSNEEIADIMNESKNLIQEVESRNKLLENECQTLHEKIERMSAQTEEMRGLMELYKEKYKMEKLSSRQTGNTSERG